MIFKGFRFGMILQLAIGPICIFVLSTAISLSYFDAQMAVFGTVFTDGLEIILAIIGLGFALNKSVFAKKVMKIFSIFILLIYGISSILSAFDVSILPSLQISFISESTFIQAVLLALSNPLTIVFWAGIFSAKIAEENMRDSDLYLFATGCVLATLFFLTLVALCGAFFSVMIPAVVIRFLNFAVGLFMLYFAYKNAKIDVNA